MEEMGTRAPNWPSQRPLKNGAGRSGPQSRQNSSGGGKGTSMIQKGTGRSRVFDSMPSKSPKETAETLEVKRLMHNVHPNGPESLQEEWTKFEELFTYVAKHGKASDKVMVRRWPALKRFCLRVSQSRIAHPSAPDLSPLTLGKVLLRVADAGVWDDSVLYLVLKSVLPHCLKAVLHKRTRARERVPWLLLEVMQVWDIYYSIRRGDTGNSGQSPPDKAMEHPLRLQNPAKNTPSPASTKHGNNFLQRWTYIFPSDFEEFDASLGSMAALTHLCLYQYRPDDRLSTQGADRFTPFFVMMNDLVSHYRVHFSELRKAVSDSNIQPSQYGDLCTLWTHLQNRLCLPTAMSYPTTLVQSHGIWPAVRFDLVGKDIHFVRKHYALFLDHLSIGIVDPSNESLIFLHFMRKFLHLSKHDDVLAAFNEAKRRKCKLNVYHYLQLIMMYRATQHADKLFAVWAEMRAQGILPDNRVWAMFLAGLVDAGHWKRALEYVEEMGQQWRATASKVANLETEYQGPNLDIFLPHIRPINALITRLLAAGIVQPISAILRWAAEFAVKPDLVTYNTLLWHYVKSPKEHKKHDLSSLLSMPNAFLDKADRYTMSILTKAIFSSRFSGFPRKTHSEQNEAVSQFLTDLNNTKVLQPPHVYVTIIHTLLSGNEPNFAAALKVLDHMANSGVPPPAHLLSLFVKCYRNAQPPAVAAMAELWTRWREAQWPLDGYIYNQILRAFAECDDVPRSREVLALGKEMNFETNWFAFAAVMGALARHQEWEEVKILGEELRPRLHGSEECQGKQAFRMQLQDMQTHGLLESPRATCPEQVAMTATS